MGDIADLMLSGDLCQVCGGYIGGGDGYPVTCEACSMETSKTSPTQKRTDVKKAPKGLSRVPRK